MRQLVRRQHDVPAGNRFGLAASAWSTASPKAGMGLIFRGQDMRSGRLVAIKTVRSRREADAAAIRRDADVPGQLDDLVMAMLAKTPAHRPDSATEVQWRLANIARRVSQRHVLSVDEPHHRVRRAG